VIGFGQLCAEVADRRSFSDASVGDEDAEAGLLEQVRERYAQLRVARALVEEGLVLGVLRQRLERIS
jgi:hypothetical protein